MAHVYDVAVIGAGLAGLTVASNLLRTNRGLSVVLTEARDLVGGRTCTIQIDCDSGAMVHNGSRELVSAQEKGGSGRRASIDVGGQWVGLQHSRTLELVDRFQMLLDPQVYPCVESGDERAESAAMKTLTLVEAVNYPPIRLSDEEFEEVDGFLGYVDELAHQLDLERPWEHPQAAELDGFSLQEVIERRVKSESVQAHLSLFAQTVLSCDPGEVGFFFFLVYLISGGGFEALGDGEQGAQKWKIVGGTQQLSSRMHEEFSALGGRSFFLSPVSRVAACSDGYAVTAGDRVVRARKVVLALSPMLAGRIQFDPALPEEKQKLCDGFIRPCCIKVFALYDRHFWLDPQSSLEVPHFSELGPVHNVFHAALGPDLFALVGLITGAEARQISEQNLSQEQLKELVLGQYRAMYGPSALKAQGFFAHDWTQEEHSGGCFASLLPKNVLSKYGPWLRKPFAGLHWCSTETAEMYCGYFEGAIRSGDRVTREILDDLSRSRL